MQTVPTDNSKLPLFGDSLAKNEYSADNAGKHTGKVRNHIVCRAVPYQKVKGSAYYCSRCDTPYCHVCHISLAERDTRNVTIECGHTFHGPCIKQHVEDSADEGKEIRCPVSACEYPRQISGRTISDLILDRQPWLVECFPTACGPKPPKPTFLNTLTVENAIPRLARALYSAGDALMQHLQEAQ